MSKGTVDAAFQFAATMMNPRREAKFAVVLAALRRMAAIREDELGNWDRGELLGELIKSELAAVAAELRGLTDELSKGTGQ